LLLAMLAALATPGLCQGVHRLGWGLLAGGSAAGRPDIAATPTPMATPAQAGAPVPAMTRPGMLRDRAPGAIDDATLPPAVEVSATGAGRGMVSWLSVALGVWGVVGALAAARLGVSLMLGRRLVAAARPIEDAMLEAAAEEARRRMGLAVRPEIRGSGRVRCPLVWCWGRRPVLLVPEGVLGRSPAVDWVSVFCHELAHWKRRDHLAGLVGEVLACVLPWHPLAWWARARLAALSELACDDWVLASGRSPVDYADALLGLLPQRRPALLPAAVSSRGGLVGRVRHILDGHRPAPDAGRAWSALAVGALALIATATALAQARPENDGGSEEPMPKAVEAASKAAGPRRALRGTVLGPNGRPAAGVSVWWLVGRKPPISFVAMPREEAIDLDDREETLAAGRTDAVGRFAFEAAYDADAYEPISQLVAWGPGHGLWGKTVRGEERDLELRLPGAVTIRGQILTPSGMPAAGVKVVLRYLQDAKSEGLGIGGRRKEEHHPDYWPRPRTTDAEGRFTIEGVPAGVFASLELTHPDYAVDELTVTTGPKTSAAIEGFEIVPVPSDFEHALEPARPVEGTVTAADTGKPLANFLVEMTPMRRHGGQPFHARTDAQGHYRVSGHQADMYITTIEPPADSGYLGVSRTHQGWPAGVKSLVMDFKLTRGKVLRGRVVEAGSGRPVAGCGLVYQPRRGNPNNRNEYDLRSPVRTDANGEFRVTALPGEGLVAVEAPEPGFIRVTLAKSLRGTVYPHGFTEVTIAAEGEPAPAVVTLRRGVTLEARVVDPDGRPVKGVVAYYDGVNARLIDKWQQGESFDDGVFRIRGADPDRAYRVFFLQPRRRLGTLAKLKYAPEAGGPIEVKLAPTASVRGRIADPAGNPVVSAQVYPQIVVTAKEGELSRNELFSEENALFYANMVGEAYYFEVAGHEKPDERGEFLFDGLIPGVRFYVTAASGGRATRQFVPPLRAGEVRDLGTLTLKEERP
jgi:beta-lactamase regulating signal transducer with metallopeptidase domain